MTLDTRIIAVTPCDGRDAFHEMRRLLGAEDRHPFRDAPCDPPHWYPEGAWCIQHPPGVGLDALLAVHYRPGLEPYRTPAQAAAHDADCDSDCDGTGWAHPPACWVEIDIDTSYGYQGPNGESCSELHARLIFEMGEWFEERRIQWGWRNEYTGEWHYEDRYQALKKLIDDGGHADRWFAEVVRPAVEHRHPGVRWYA